MSTKTITVTGSGSVSVKPDITRVNLSISAVKPTYIESYELAQDYNRQIKGFMRRLKLDDKLPKTTRFQIDKKKESVYVNGNYSHEKFVGYKLSQEVHIDLGMDNLILGKVLKMVATEMVDTEISISYTVSDSKQAQYDLIEDAARDAKEKALRITRAVGCTLGDILTINYSWRNINLYRELPYEDAYLVRPCALTSEGPLDIEPEDLKASDDVTFVWEIKQG